MTSHAYNHYNSISDVCVITIAFTICTLSQAAHILVNDVIV